MLWVRPPEKGEREDNLNWNRAKLVILAATLAAAWIPAECRMAQSQRTLAVLASPLAGTAVGQKGEGDRRDSPTGTAPVILISVDTLRADHLSCYGYSRLETPHIDSLVGGGTLFAEIYSQAPITLPSHASLFTSTYSFANGIRENAQVLPPGTVTLATALAAHGYDTAAFIGGYFLDRRFGLAQGFQTYDSPFEEHALNVSLDLKRPAAQVLEDAEHWLEHSGGRPFLLFIHLFDLHQPYNAPAAYHSRAPQSGYNQELAYVDDSLGHFFDYLAQRGLDRRALVVLVSDHGEDLGDHGEFTHGYFIYCSTLHVPLIFHWPQNAESRNSKRVAAPAGLIDVAPTVLSFLGIPAPASFCGHSLLVAGKGGDVPPRDVYSESTYAHDKFGWAALRSLRRGDYQYIDAPRPELYDLKRDPAQLHNLLPAQSALAASYRERMTSLVAAFRSAPGAAPPFATAPGAAESLRALGYLDISAPQAALDNWGVDPKDRLLEYRRYQIAGHLARSGKAREAVAEFHAILASDPRNLPAYIDLARTDMGLHQYLESANQLKAVLALDPRNVEAKELLGEIWLAEGDLEQAETEFHQLLTIVPQDPDAHRELGLVLARKGDPGAATGEYRLALRLNPNDEIAHLNLGLALSSQGDWDGAIVEERAALRLAPRDDTAHVYLGAMLGQKGDRDGAMAEYREALRLNPANHLAHYNLGVALEKTGDRQGALREYRAAHELNPDAAPYRQAYERLAQPDKP